MSRLTRAGRGMVIKTFESLQDMKSFDKFKDGEVVHLISWHLGKSLGSGDFVVSKTSTATGDDGYIVVADDGTRLTRVITGNLYADMWGALPSSTYNSYNAIKAAYAYAYSVNTQLFLAGGHYVIQGATSIDINPTRAGISSLARCFIDASGMTSDYVFTISSESSYTPAPYNNNLNTALQGLYVYGNKTAGVSGLLCGKRVASSTKSYNGQTEIRDCTFDKFDYNIRMGHNSWRFVFWKVNSLNASNDNGILYIPSGLDDSGEIMSFYHCQFFDGSGSNIRLSCNSYCLIFNTCSFLNITFYNDAGNSTTVTCNGCNFENPGSTSTRRYVDITAGHTHVFTINGGTIVTNRNGGQTQALFNVSANNQLNFCNLTIPYGAHYQQETETGYHGFVSGNGSVTTSGCMLQLNNGAGCCPLHPSLSNYENWNLSYGDTSGWTVNKGTDTTSLVEVLSGLGPKGEHVLHVAPVSQGVNISQVTRVEGVGGFSLSLMVNVISASASAKAGQISVTYLSESDKSLGGVSANIDTTTGWKVIGKTTLRGRLPIGTKKLRLNIQTVAGASVYYTNILSNVIK